MEQGVLVLRSQPIKDHPDAILVTVEGSIDPKSTTYWKNELDALLAKGITQFILDCERLTYINSSGLAYLLNVAGMVKTKAGAIALAAVDSKIMVIFKMMSVMELFQFHPTYADALKELDEKVKRELRDVGPALVLEEPPPPPKPVRTIPPPPTNTPPVRAVTPFPAPVKTITPVRLAARPESTRKMVRPQLPPPPPVNPIVRFFRALFGIGDSRPFFRRLNRRRL